MSAGFWWRSRWDSNPGAREGKRFSSFLMTRQMPLFIAFQGDLQIIRYAFCQSMQSMVNHRYFVKCVILILIRLQFKLKALNSFDLQTFYLETSPPKSCFRTGLFALKNAEKRANSQRILGDNLGTPRVTRFTVPN